MSAILSILALAIAAITVLMMSFVVMAQASEYKQRLQDKTPAPPVSPPMSTSTTVPPIRYMR